MSTVSSRILSTPEQEIALRSAGVPVDDGGPVFRAPWEAQAFALAVQLNARGVFSWPEWAAALGAEIASDGMQAEPGDSYRHWLAALEKLVVSKAGIAETALEARREDWRAAAAATPHGEPVRLVPKR
jgi:nitrile hydratase accessory protein